MHLPGDENRQLDLFETGRYARSRFGRTAVRVGFVALLFASGLSAACSSFSLCNLHWEDGHLVVDQCAGQDQEPPKDGPDEKPATNDPEEPTG